MVGLHPFDGESTCFCCRIHSSKAHPFRHIGFFVVVFLVENGCATQCHQRWLVPPFGHLIFFTVNCQIPFGLFLTFRTHSSLQSHLSGLQVPRGPLHQLGEPGHLPSLDHEDPHPGSQGKNCLSPGQNGSNLNWVAGISTVDINYCPGYLWVKSAPELRSFGFTKCSQLALGDKIAQIFLY